MRRGGAKRGKAGLHLFESALSVSGEDLELGFRGQGFMPWADFLLNPRSLRGSDFLMRWSQGVWSEQRMIQAINETGRYFALPYGPSGTAPDNDVREYELYFERLELVGLGQLKRPDLLIFKAADRPSVEDLVCRLGGVKELPFVPEEDGPMIELLRKAIIAVECENSLWLASRMPDFGTALTPQKRLGGQPGLKKSAIVPTVILKEEDRAPLRDWQGARKVPIHIWHSFFDLAFGIAFDYADRLIERGQIEPKEFAYQAPNGIVTKKLVYFIWYQHAYPLAEAVEEPALVAESIVDKNGHILPYVRFDGGRLRIRSEATGVLGQLAVGE